MLPGRNIFQQRITMPVFDCLLVSNLCNFRVENRDGGFKQGVYGNLIFTLSLQWHFYKFNTIEAIEPEIKCFENLVWF